MGIPTITGTPTERSDADGEHRRHQRRRRSGCIQLPVAAQRSRHRRRHREHLHAGPVPTSARRSVCRCPTPTRHGTGEGPLASAPDCARWPTSTTPPSALPTIGGTVTEDQTLRPTPAHRRCRRPGRVRLSVARSNDGAPLAIAGATADTYTLGDADVGALIKSSVSYTDGQGTAESLTSASARAGGQRQRCAGAHGQQPEHRAGRDADPVGG